ncbi:hypothetical protein AAG747_18890 [Rapidithrix thailandica]|uniref:Lipoprotein n=1 Tax=Rapidithrix thailandica TaxID=413964 RepID=A0AAW9SAI6_9BACT
MKIINKNSTVIGLLLISLISCLYGYYIKNPLEKNELKTIIGTLREKPFLGESGGDMPSQFIRVRIQEDDKNYDLIDCSFDACKAAEVLKLNPGKQIIISIKHSDVHRRTVDVFALSTNHNFLLKLEDYNKCNANRWRMFVPFIIITALILLYRILRPWIKGLR